MKLQKLTDFVGITLIILGGAILAKKPSLAQNSRLDPVQQCMNQVQAQWMPRLLKISGNYSLPRNSPEWEFAMNEQRLFQEAVNKCLRPVPQSLSYQIPKHWPTPQYNNLVFDSCAEAVNYIEKGAEIARIGWGRPELDLTTMKPIRYKYLPNNSVFQVDVTVNYRINPPVTFVKLPKITWSNMTDAEKSALQKTIDDLIVHEDGHIKVAEEWALSRSGRTFSATGSTLPEAKQNLKDELEMDLTKQQVELFRREQYYDDITQHGTTQSKGARFGLPGGNDAVLACP